MTQNLKIIVFLGREEKSSDNKWRRSQGILVPCVIVSFQFPRLRLCFFLLLELWTDFLWVFSLKFVIIIAWNQWKRIQKTNSKDSLKEAAVKQKRLEIKSAVYHHTDNTVVDWRFRIQYFPIWFLSLLFFIDRDSIWKLFKPTRFRIRGHDTHNRHR